MMWIFLIATVASAADEAVMIRPGEQLWLAPGEAPVRLSAWGAGPAVVVSRRDGWLELGFRGDSPCPGVHPDPDRFELHLWAQESALAPVVTRRIEQRFGDDTVVVHAGWTGGREEGSLAADIAHRIPEDAWGSSFVITPEEGPPGTWASQRQLGWSGTVTLLDRSWSVSGSMSQMSPAAPGGRARIVVSEGCLDLSVGSYAASPSRGGTMWGVGGLGGRGGPREVIGTIAAGSELIWPDGRLAGRAYADLRLGDASREGPRVCGTFPAAGVRWQVCAARARVRLSAVDAP